MSDWLSRFDYSNLIARLSLELCLSGLTWRSPLVIGWMAETGAATHHDLSVDGFEWMLERVAIAIEDGGLGDG